MKEKYIQFMLCMVLLACGPEPVEVEDPDKSPDLDARIVLLAHKAGDEYLRDLDFADDMNGMAVGLSTAIPSAMYYRTTDGGETWNHDLMPVLIPGATTYSFYAIHFENGDGFLSGGSSNGFFFIAKSEDKGFTWSVKAKGISYVPVEFDFYGKYGIGVGNFGHVWITGDSGETWTEKTIPGTEDLLNVNFVDENHLYASSGASIFFSSDQGKSWTEKLNQGGGGAHMEMVSANEGFSSFGTGIIKTEDGCDSWKEIWNINNYITANENSMIAGTQTIAMQFIAKKHFMISNDGGKSFKSYKLPHNDNFNISLDSKMIWNRYAVKGDYFYVLPSSINTEYISIYRIRYKY